MKTLAIIQARTTSTRLPGKVLMRVEDKTILEHVLDRVEECKLVDEVMVATTINKSDLSIVELCAKRGTRVFCGSEDDVLDRYYQAARIINSKNIVRITSDCPVIDPAMIDRVVKFHEEGSFDYSANSIKETFPDGQDVEVFKLSALKEAWEKAVLLSEREHVTPYIKNHPERFLLGNIESDINYSSKRWTVDNAEDLEFIKIIYGALYNENKIFSMDDILKYLKNNPEVENINNHIVRNLGLIKSLKEDKKIEKE